MSVCVAFAVEGEGVVAKGACFRRTKREAVVEIEVIGSSTDRGDSCGGVEPGIVECRHVDGRQ